MYAIRLELGREGDESLFIEYQRNIAAKEREEAINARKKAKLLKGTASILSIVFLLLGCVFFAYLDINEYKQYRDIRYEIEHRPVITAANPLIDTSYREELIAIQEEEEARALAIPTATEADTLKDLGETVLSEFAIVVDVNNRSIVASRKGREKFYPASMTKVLTVLVAAENISEEQLNDTFTVTSDINYYSYKNGLSAVGFSDDETVTVRDLFYGTILPSGGDAAVSLATYVAGSQEAFVELMNKKLEELGLSETSHFTNCVGMYDDDHYSSCYDIAMILNAAINNEWCKQVLSTHHYVTTPTLQHPDGIEMSNWFLRRIEDKPCGGVVTCAKTGYVEQSGNCAASYATDEKGNDYICVTGNAPGSWKCIYDHVRTYRQFFPDYDESMANVEKEKDEFENGVADH